MKKLFTTTIAATILLTTNIVVAYDFNSTPDKISAHLVAPAQSLDSIKKKLTDNGFKILATTNIIDGHDVITITNDELQATNTYMAAIHVSVNGTDVRVQNPSYLGAAFLGNKYKYGKFKATVNALEKALGSLKGSKQKTDLSDLEDYNFMMGMPKVDDTIIVKEGKNLASKVKNSAYKLTLPSGLILVGHKLNKKTNKFLKTLGEEKNAQILPYESMVSANKAEILDPKFYLALSLPNLSMGQFMEIASVPDEIEEDIIKDYK